MTLKSQEQNTGIKSPDIEKLKAYLIDTLARDLEVNPPNPLRRDDEVRERLNQIYDHMNLRLGETIRTQVIRDVLDNVLGYGPIQPFLEDIIPAWD